MLEVLPQDNASFFVSRNRNDNCRLVYSQVNFSFLSLRAPAVVVQLTYYHEDVDEKLIQYCKDEPNLLGELWLFRGANDYDHEKSAGVTTLSGIAIYKKIYNYWCCWLAGLTVIALVGPDACFLNRRLQGFVLGTLFF